MRIGIVISNTATTSPTHSTVHIAQAALEAGHSVRFIEPWDFEISPDGRLWARAHCFDAPTGSRDELASRLALRQTERLTVEIRLLDRLLLRANPLHEAIQSIARLAQAEGVPVLNPPEALIHCSHKGWLATLPGVPRPETLITRSRAAAERFSASVDAAVVKPARACGGKGVSLIRGGRGLQEAISLAQRVGDGYIVMQRYLPEAALGEKRLLWLDGALIGGYLRQRAPGEFRHNLKAGGTPAALQTSRDRTLQDQVQEQQIIDTLTPHLRRYGIWFAGVDVIGDQVVEVNVLNPGGLHWSSVFAGAALAPLLIDHLQRPAPSPPGLSSFSTGAQ